VQQPTPLSDHAQLTCRLRTDKPFIEQKDKNTKLFVLPRQFKWNSESNERFVRSLQSDRVKSLINDFELTYFELNKVDINKGSLRTGSQAELRACIDD
jgi:hypothetical protein